MNYQWYPGHMTKARRMMQENIKLIDLVIELVDARIPISSRNPDIDELGKGKSRIILLNKSDLADPVWNKKWVEYFSNQGMGVLEINSRTGMGIKSIQGLVQEVCKEKIERDRKRGIVNRPVRAMVVGIPNVGKSTFINSFAGKACAKTGNKPGVTKGKQWIRLNKGVELLDTPGILWPKFEDQSVGLKLALIGSIRDKKRLDEVFETYHPTVVFHAAAHKHVPLMEISPAEAVKNNVFGTKNLLTSAAEHGVERFVQLSTDKAVNPTNVMGCTKRLCEMLIQTFSRATSMTCVAVRFGNVLGSHGSVIPLFEAQIKKGGPVTLTDPNIVRYFMTITEAAQLVLQAGGLAKGGSIYVLDMGEPVKIMDLANRLIRFYGYEPGVNMQVKVTGLRPGEKLYEELLMDSEQDKMAKTAHNKIFIAPPMQIDLEKFYTDLQRLKDSALHNSDEVVDVLQEMVPTYHPNRRVRADHTVVAATGNTALFSREEIAQKLRETEHPAEEG